LNQINQPEDTKIPNCYYVLGWEQPNSKIAILCRGSGGPALCRTWKESLKLRTSLLNDPRASNNSHAQGIIRELRIYRMPKGEALFWRPGDLWVYVDRRVLESLEA
jgi:hypothetical protein